MIFVTVGTDTHQFDRLLKEIDRLLAEKKIKEDVVAQTGNSGYSPKNCKYSGFFSEEEFSALLKKADLVISHAGAGSIIRSLEFGKATIIVPRRKKYGEHTDDHQMELAKELEIEGKAIVVYNINNLEDAIKKAKNENLKIEKQKQDKIIKMISEKLAEWEK